MRVFYRHTAARGLTVAFFLCLCVVSICGCGPGGFMSAPPEITKRLVVEAGMPIPPPEAFVQTKNTEVQYAGVVNIDAAEPGEYPVTLLIGNSTYTSLLAVEDKTPPTGTPVRMVVWEGETVEPSDFVRQIYDITEVSLSFAGMPDTKTPGERVVTVVLTDESGNTTYVDAPLCVYAAPVELEVSIGTDIETITAHRFISGVNSQDENLFTADLRTVDTAKPGRYVVLVTLGRRVKSGVLNVPDVTPPTGRAVAVSGWVGGSVSPESFVRDIEDETEVNVSFITKPDMSTEGSQTVGLLLTDEYGNTSELTGTLTIQKDREPPVISGSVHKEVFIGDNIAYRSGVTATDNRLGQISFDVDSSSVNIYAVGTYPVVYTAGDADGNTTVVEGSVTVFDVSREQIDAMADEVLAQIINDSMTQYDKAKAVYNWIIRKMSYVGTSVKDNVTYAAYRGFRDGRGDCYVYYALSEVLLTRAGIENLPIKRIPGTPTRHFWNLVNVGDGWYHFDTVPHMAGGSGFMLTESQAQDYTRRRGKEYYTYDASLYPEVAP